jgi:hypothetical protein
MTSLESGVLRIKMVELVRIAMSLVSSAVQVRVTRSIKRITKVNYETRKLT